MSHVYETVVKYIILQIDKIFGGLKFKIGPIQTYLGMELELNENLTVSMGMTEYILEAIDAFSKISPITSKTTSPSQKKLFEVDETSPKLDETRSVEFHHYLDKLLYVCKRFRLDILLAIIFLCTRVTFSTVQDWLKIKSFMRYLFGTKELRLTLGASDFSIMDVYIDASYAVHPDMRSHTGGCIKFGRGVLIPKSTK